MKRPARSLSMVESLESRRLLSASPATIQADFNSLTTDAKSVRTAGKTLETDLIAAIPPGTKGSGVLKNDLLRFKDDGKSMITRLSTDVAAVQSNSGNPLNEAEALATLHSDLTSGRATLKTDFEAIVAVVAKHPTLISHNAQLTTDYTTVSSDWSTTKADFKKLKSDLA